MRSAMLTVSALLMLPATATAVEGRLVIADRGEIRLETIAEGLDHPWSLAFLPDGRMLVTERPGRLRYVDGEGRISPPLHGLPQVFSEGQGGLLDIPLDPEFATNRLIYISYGEPGEDGASI